MAIYAGAASPGTPGGGPVSDDDYFTDDGILDHGKIASPRGDVAGMAAIQSPTNARNARLTGAAPPPTLGEIESHLNDPSHGEEVSASAVPPVASPSARSTISTSSSNRVRPMPENGMGGGASNRKPKKLGRGFFDESFEDAFPADNFDAFNTSMDKGSGTTSTSSRAAPSPSAQRRANKGSANQGVLHDPFGTMPSLPTPTSSSAGNDKSTSVAAKRRAKAAATGNLVVNTATTSPNNDGAAANSAASPTTMLDFALQGTPVAADGANAGYPSEDDDKEAEGVLGAVASPKSWKGAAPSKVDTSREGLIGSDDLSPSNAPTVMSDAEARLEEERERREAEEKKNRFLSKMIMRVSCNRRDCMHRVLQFDCIFLLRNIPFLRHSLI